MEVWYMIHVSDFYIRKLRVLFQASMVAMLAGSDFIKTSTGKESVNATIPVGIVMCRAIYDYHRQNYRFLSNTIFFG